MNLLLSFLLCFPYEDEMVLESENVYASVNTKPKKRKKSLLSNCFSESTLNDINFIRPSANHKKSCTVQYNLPSKLKGKKVIKVVYFGTCAKITLDDASTMVKCYVVGDKSFIAFTVVHKVNTKDIDAPMEIMSHNIQVDFRSTNDKSNDKTSGKLFYHLKQDESDLFGYLLESKNGEVPESGDNNSIKCNDHDYLLLRPCKFHWNTLNKSIKKTYDYFLLMQSKVNDDKPKCPRDESLGRGINETTVMKDKKNKSGNGKSADIKLNVSGSHLVSEKSVWIFQDFNPLPDASLLHAGVVLTNTSLYNEEQRKFYKPLSIYVKSIRNLPPSVRKVHKINEISLQYSLPPICTHEIISAQKINGDKIKIKDVRMFFNHNVEDAKLIEAIQSEFLSVKLIGHRNAVDSTTEAKVWGQDLNCREFTKRINKFIDRDNSISSNNKEKNTNNKNANKNSKKNKNGQPINLKHAEVESVVLGFALVSLNGLMESSFLTVQFSEISSSFQPMSENSQLRPMNVMHFHRDQRPLQKGIVDSKDYLYFKTALKLELRLGYDLLRNVLHEVLSLPYLYTICIIIDNDISRTYELLKEITNHNMTCLPNCLDLPVNLFQNTYIFPEIQSAERNHPNQTDNKRNSVDSYEDEEYITGFMVDAIEYCILFVECLEVHALPKILVHRYQMLRSEGKLLYDSNLVFTKRYFGEFVKFGGIFVSALGVPFNSVLNHPRSKEFVPPTALRCLQSLQAIADSTQIQRGLFPSCLELLSMDMEFGVPLHKADVIKPEASNNRKAGLN